MRTNLLAALLAIVPVVALGQETDKPGRDRLAKELDSAVAGYFLNEANVGDYMVRYVGKTVNLSDSGAMVTSFSGLTAIRGGSVRIEGFSKAEGSVTQRFGMLRSGSAITIVEGVDELVQPRDLSKEEKQSIVVPNNIDPFRLLYIGPAGVAAGDASVFKQMSPRFQSGKLLKAFEDDDGKLGGIWLLTKKYRMVQVVYFSKDLGMMPVIAQCANVRPNADWQDLGPDDLDVWMTNRIAWEEPEPNLFVPAMADMKSHSRYSDDEDFTQIKMKWAPAPDPKLFSKEHLLAFHRSVDFVEIERPDISLDEKQSD